MKNDTGNSKQYEKDMLVPFLRRTVQIRIIALYIKRERTDTQWIRNGCDSRHFTCNLNSPFAFFFFRNFSEHILTCLFCLISLPDNLKRIDLTANFISEIHEDAFRRLPQLEELVLRDNRIRQLPELPSTLTFIDVSKNRLGRKGIRNEAFKVSLSLMGKSFPPLSKGCGRKSSLSVPLEQ